MVTRGAALALGLWGAATLAGPVTAAGAPPPTSAGAPAPGSAGIPTPASAGEGDAGPFALEVDRAEARLRSLRGRPEAVAPLAVIGRAANELPPRRLEELLRSAASDASHPLVAAHASLMLAAAEEQRGDAAAADRRREGLGLLRQFWVVGPFGEGRASFSQPFPPETETGGPDGKKTYPGKERDVAWRRADESVRMGALLLDGLLRPDTQAVGYVFAYVHSERARDAALRLGSPGPLKAWVNGAVVFSRDVVREPVLDQDAALVHLERGWNRLLIKTVVTDGAWRICARFTELGGRPLRLGNEAVPPPGAEAAPNAAARPARSRPAPFTLEAALRARARSAGSGAAAAAAWLDLGRYLMWIAPADREAREELAALEQSNRRRPSLEALLAIADVAREDDERRAALERVLALSERDTSVQARSARGLAFSRLAEIAREGNRDAVAMDHWRAALGADPSCWPATLALAAEELESGFPRRALERLGTLPASVGEVSRAMRLRARVLEAVDRRPEADALLAQLEQGRRLDSELAHQLAGRARVQGDAARAVAHLRRAAELRPDLPSLTLELARAIEGQGDPAGALTVLAALDARMRDEPAAQAQLGKLLHRMGRRDQALVHLRSALALKPQDPELRRYTERVAAASAGEGRDLDAPGEDLARRYATDAAALLPPARKAAPPARPELAADPAVVLLDRRVVRVHRNGLSETFAQRVVQIETDRGAEDNKQFYVRYTPGQEEVEIRQARIFRRGPEGAVQILAASERDDQDLSEPWYGLYYDNRAEVVQFEGLRAGDVLEVQYVVADVAGRNMMADYFGDLQFVAEAIPKRHWEYILIGPRSRTFHLNTSRIAGLQSGAAEQGDDRVHRFSARDVAKLAAEPAMPGYAEVGPYLHVSTYASWSEVGAWYWRLVAEQLVGDETLRKTARDATAGRTTDEQKVLAIHELVVTGTRYVGLEFGIHGFKPYKVTQVLSRRFGDCKDKAALMVALLREAGVDAEMVLLRTRGGGRIDTTPASLAVFDHAIVYVPTLDVYLDGTAEFSGKSELPSQDQGVMGLRVSARGATLIETPILPSNQNRASRTWTVDLSAGGAARIAETLVITGQAAPEWRQHYQTAGERLDRYAKVWSGRYPGANLISVEMPGLGDRNQPVTVKATASVPRLGQSSDGVTFDLPVTVREADFSRTYARLSQRKYDLVIAYPWQHDEELTYRLPPGTRVGRLPAGLVAESPFGRFRLEISVDDGRVVRVRSALDITRHRLTPAEYPRFRQFLGDIDAALGDRIVVQKESP